MTANDSPCRTCGEKTKAEMRWYVLMQSGANVFLETDKEKTCRYFPVRSV